MGCDFYLNPPGQLERDRVRIAAIELVRAAKRMRGRGRVVQVPAKQWEELVRLAGELERVR